MRRCPVDGTPIALPREGSPDGAALAARSDAAYCSPRCRQAASRARRGLRHGWGDATDRAGRRARSRASAAVTGQEGD